MPAFEPDPTQPPAGDPRPEADAVIKAQLPGPDGIPPEAADSSGDSDGKPQRRPGRPVLAWVAIVLLVGIYLALSRQSPRPTKTTEAGNDLQTRVLELQAKYLVAASEATRSSGQSGQLLGQPAQLDRSLGSLNQGPLAQRLRYVCLVGELIGDKRAIEALDELYQLLKSSPTRATADQRRVMDRLWQLYRQHARSENPTPAPDADSPAAMDRGEAASGQKALAADHQLVVQQLGWFGRLALSRETGPESPLRKQVLAEAQPALVGLIGLGLVVALLGLAGLGGGAVLGTLALMRKLRHGFGPASRGPALYAETFAIWFLSYLGCSVLLSLAFGDRGPVIGVVAFTLSLLALTWPVLRGLSWREVRREIGWTLGPRPLLEVVFGVIGYVSALPLLLLGLAGTMVALSVQGAWQSMLRGVDHTPTDPFAPQPIPSHPATEWLQSADWSGILLVFAIACVMAPLVEETFFRGVLYRHLRDMTRRWRVAWSVLFGAAVNCFIFGIIHPIPLAVTPVLMSLALGFTLIREWRGSLLACMTAHSLHNSLILVVTLLIF